MLQSSLFTKTRKEAPKDEVSKNAQLLIRGGFIHKEMAGVYSLLPLGLRVIKNIEHIIRKEMNAVGGQELELNALQDKSVWEKSGRWNDEVLDVWFKTQLKNGTELGLGTTHEEPLTALMKEYIHSYRDLPRYPYQFQTKFRNETRSKSGMLRGREFLMKDLYSFSKDVYQHDDFYKKIQSAYKNIFNAVGIGHKTFLTRAAGGSFSKFSHEFQMICESGEDIIYMCEGFDMAINEEIIDSPEAFEDMEGVSKEDFKPHKSIEVGNIFNLGTRFSDAFELTYLDEQGKPQPVIMGSYGIGVGRLMGAIVEALSDEKGIVWPETVAPCKIHLISLGDSETVRTHSQKMYEAFIQKGIEVLWDDRDLRAGEKFADADLIGIPFHVVISEKTLAEQNVEAKHRKTGDTRMHAYADVIKNPESIVTIE